MKYRTVKVFDDGDLPQDIYDLLVNELEINEYCTWRCTICPDDDDRNAISRWFIDNGANEGELILITFEY